MARSGNPQTAGSKSMRTAPPTDQANGAYVEQLSFFPQPEFCPTRPKKDSNSFKALVLMLDGPITQIEWLERRLGWRLAATINELVNLGWQPISKRVMGSQQSNCKLQPNPACPKSRSTNVDGANQWVNQNQMEKATLAVEIQADL